MLNQNIKVSQSKCSQHKAKNDCQGDVCDCFFHNDSFDGAEAPIGLRVRQTLKLKAICQFGSRRLPNVDGNTSEAITLRKVLFAVWRIGDHCDFSGVKVCWRESEIGHVTSKSCVVHGSIIKLSTKKSIRTYPNRQFEKVVLVL